MEPSIAMPRIAKSHARLVTFSLAALLFTAVLFGVLLTSGAQAYTYTNEESTFVNLLNEYRVANGLSPLLVSDLVSEACYRHNHDMAKYSFFSHNSEESDWFATDALPWDRMSLSGYSFNTNKGENIAAGQPTAAEVFNAWKASAGHNANMLNSSYTVLGVSQYQLTGSPYTFYWTTDFGGYTDSTAHEVNGTPPPTTTRYQQTDSHIAYAGTWFTYSIASASSGGYKRANTSTGSCTVTFNGTYLAWVATRGTTLGKAYVSLDGGPAQLIDLSRTSVAYQQKVWNTVILTNGQHTVKIWRYPGNAAGKYISVDAFDVAGTLATVPATVGEQSTRYQQSDSHIIYGGTWSTFKKSTASGGSYKRAATSTASVTVNFTGTHLAWIATAGTTLGKAWVSLDSGAPVSIDLARTAVAYQQEVWNTGTLASGPHTVRIWRDITNVAGKYISVDAFVVWGALN